MSTFFPGQQDYIDALNALAAGGSVSYATGTFTPVLSGATSGGSGTYSTQSGKYAHVGNQVLFEAIITISAHTGTGDMRVSGLPVTADSSQIVPVQCRISNAAFSGVVDAYVNTSSTQIFIPGFSFGSVLAGLPLTLTIRGRYLG